MTRQHRIAGIVSTMLMALWFFSEPLLAQDASQPPAQQQPETSQQPQQQNQPTPPQSQPVQPDNAPSNAASPTDSNTQTAAPSSQQQQAPSSQQQQAPAAGGTTLNPSQAPLQPVTTYPDATGAAQEQPGAEAAPRTTTVPEAPQPKKQPTEPVGAAAAESVPTAGGAAAKPAGVAIAPAKQHQTRSLLLKIGAVAAAGAALGAVFALSRGTPSTPPGAATPGAAPR